MGIDMGKCFLSGKPVLALSGQFSYFDSYLLNSREECDQARDKTGYCYNLHLINSEWGVFWAQRFLRNLVEVKGYCFHREEGDFLSVRRTVRSDGHIDVCVFRKSDGLRFFFDSRKNKKKPKRGSDGLLFPVEKEYNLRLSGFPGLPEEFQAALEKDGEYPLVRLAERINVLEDMIFPQALEGGKFKYDSELREDWSPRSDVPHFDDPNILYYVSRGLYFTFRVRVSYFYFIPYDVSELLFAALDP